MQTGKAPDRTPLPQNTPPVPATATGQKLRTDLDDLLDEIDRILERNAAAFRLTQRAAETPSTQSIAEP